MAATKVSVTAEKMNALVEFVRSFNEKQNRGCPAEAIRYVGGFEKAEIKAAKDNGLIKGTLGAEGGFYPADATPVPKKDQKGASLKSRMADLLRKYIDCDTEALELVNEYEAELAKRKTATKQ